MMAFSLSISLAQKGQRGARSTSVTPYDFLSSSSSAGALAAALGSGFAAGALPLAGPGLAFGAGWPFTGKAVPHSLQRIFLPSASAATLSCFLHFGQETTME